jgi:hypothetical protein
MTESERAAFGVITRFAYASKNEGVNLPDALLSGLFQDVKNTIASHVQPSEVGCDGEDRCKQCGKRCPIATCPGCQEQNASSVARGEA